MLYKQRDFGELINTTFAFLRQNFKALAKAQFFINGPLLLICILCLGVGQYFMLSQISGYTTTDTDAFTTLNFGLSGFLNILFLIGAVIYFVMLSLVPVVYIKLYQALEDPNAQKIEPSHVWNTIKKYLAGSLGAAILVYLTVVVGAFLCVLPGVWLVTSFSLFIPVLVLENEYAIESIKRSFALVKDNWWETFGFLLVISIISSIIVGVAYVPIYLVLFVTLFNTASANMEEAQGFIQDNLIWYIISLYGMTLLIAVISVSIQQIAFTFKFGHLVEFKEGKGLLSEINNVVGGSENDAL